MPTLEKRNPLPNGADKDIKFNKDAHKYTVKTSGFDLPVEMSVTELLKEHFEDFDPWRKAANGVEKWAKDETHWNHHLVRYLQLRAKLSNEDVAKEMAAYWSAIGQEASDAGTAMHEILEDFVNGRMEEEEEDAAIAATKRPGKPAWPVVMFLDFLDRYYPELELKPWRSELRIFMRHPDHAVPLVAGSVDLVMVDKHGNYHIVDFKRIKPSKGLLGKASASQKSFKKRNATGRFSDFEASEYNKYSAQLLIYKYILESEFDMKVASCVLLQMHPEMPDLKPHWVEAAELDEAVEKFMDDLIEKKHYEFQDGQEAARKRIRKRAEVQEEKGDEEENGRLKKYRVHGCNRIAELLLERSDIKYVVTYEGDEFYVVWVGTGHVDRRMVLHLSQERAADLQKRVHGAGGSDVDLQTLTSEEFVQFAKILALVVEHGPQDADD